LVILQVNEELYLKMAKDTIKNSTNEIDVIASKMSFSLESTNKGLALFLDSLQKSGFYSSLPAYQQMMSILIQQKKWADANLRIETQPLWNEIAKNSDNIYQIMNAYSGIMDNLRKLSINNLQKNKIKQFDNKEKILNYLKKYSEFSISELSENLKMKKKEIKEELEPLIKKGIIERKGKGKTLCYKLKEISRDSRKTP